MYIEVINEYKPIIKIRRRMTRLNKTRKIKLVKRRGKWYIRRQWIND